MRKIFVFGLLAFLIAFNAACTPETPLPPTPAPRDVPGLNLEVVLPSNGAILMPGPTTVRTELQSTRCCITRASLLVNGHSIATHTISGSTISTNQSFSWTPSTTGEYFLQVQGTLSTGASGISPVTRVCVLNVAQSNPSAGGYLGPCAIPTRIPSAPTEGLVSMTAIFSPQPLTVLPLSCSGGNNPTLTINATVNDPADQVFAAIGFIGFSDFGVIFYLNWYSSEPGGVKLFHGTYTPPNTETSITSIQWNASALARNNELIYATPIEPVTVYQGTCSHEEIGTAAPLQIVPSATPGNLIANVQAYPSPIYYGNTCPSVSNLSFRAALVLPPGMDPKLLQVLAHASIDGSDGSPAGSLTVPLSANGTFDTASGGSVFLGTLDLSHSYKDSNNQFDPASLGGGNGSLHWYITVANQNSEMGRSSEQTLNLAPCPISGQPASTGSAGSSGNACQLSIAACEKLGENFDPTKCSCYIP